MKIVHATMGCPFCERMANLEFERTAYADVVRFAPLNPVTEGHMLFVPMRHVQDALTDPRLTGLVMAAASNYAWPDCNIITSVGAAATQTVFHLHLHVVPRRPDDGLALPWTGQVKG